MDISFYCKACGQHILIDVAGAGMTVQCPSCTSSITVPSSSVQRPAVPPPIVRQPQKENCMKEYKVMTQKDRFFGGKFDPEKLEGAINSYASQGWTVKAIATATIPSLTGSREEMIVVLEREK
jgi:hypothetical protein